MKDKRGERASNFGRKGTAKENVATNLLMRCNMVSNRRMSIAEAIQPVCQAEDGPVEALPGEIAPEVPLPLLTDTKVFNGWKVSYRLHAPETVNWEKHRPKLQAKLKKFDEAGVALDLEAGLKRSVESKLASMADASQKKRIREKRTWERLKLL